MKTLDLKKVVESAEYHKDKLGNLQIAVYVAVGGGLLGRLTAEQPADFYIDTRAGRPPYPKRAIYQAVKVLAGLAKANGLDPHHMPPMPSFHGAGLF